MITITPKTIETWKEGESVIMKITDKDGRVYVFNGDTLIDVINSDEIKMLISYKTTFTYGEENESY